MPLHQDEQVIDLDERGSVPAVERSIVLRGISWSERDLVEVMRSEPGSPRERLRVSRLREELSDHLYGVMFKVLKKKLRLGLLDVELPWPADYKPGDQQALQDSEAVRDDLVCDVISMALPWFWDRAIDSGWWSPDREGGAGLETYAVGAAFRVFPDAYAQWARVRHEKLRDRFRDVPDVAFLGTSGEDSIAIKASFDEVRRLARPVAEKLLVLQRLGYSPTEAGAVLGLTGRSVEGHMRRLRDDIAVARSRGRIRPPWDTRPAPDDGLPRLDFSAPTREQLRRRGSVVR